MVGTICGTVSRNRISTNNESSRFSGRESRKLSLSESDKDEYVAWSSHPEAQAKGRGQEKKFEQRDDPKDKPDSFDGARREDYPKWRAKVHLWLADTKCPANKKAIRIMRVFHDKACGQIEGFMDDLERFQQVGGEKVLLKILDEAYEFNEEQDLQKKFDDVIYAPVKGNEIEMATYLNEYLNLIKKLEK